MSDLGAGGGGVLVSSRHAHWSAIALTETCQSWSSTCQDHRHANEGVTGKRCTVELTLSFPTGGFSKRKTKESAE